MKSSPKETPPSDDRRTPRRINIANRDIPSAMEQLAASWKRKQP